MKAFLGRHLAAVVIVVGALAAMFWPAYAHVAWSGRYILSGLAMGACAVIIALVVARLLVPGKE